MLSFLRRCSATFHGEPGGTRTRDPLIKSQMLYQLSYRPIAFLQVDALPNCLHCGTVAQAPSVLHQLTSASP